MVPIHLLLEIVKHNEVTNVILINQGIYINRDYLARLKIKECGLKYGDFDIYINIKQYLIKNEIVDYQEIFVFSAEIGNLLVVKFLYDFVDINCINQNNFTALERCASCGNLEVVKYLVNKGGDIHTYGDYALRFSSSYGHLEVVKFLVSQGADIHAVEDCALRWSARTGHLEVVKFLVSQGANIHAKEDYALRWSSENGHLEIVNFLVSQGANIIE